MKTLQDYSTEELANEILRRKPVCAIVYINHDENINCECPVRHVKGYSGFVATLLNELLDDIGYVHDMDGED